MAYIEDSNRVPHGERFNHNSLEPEGKTKTREVYSVTILLVILMELNRLRHFLVRTLF
jgi:hypothetical protein